jgi:hypothetical protein
VELGDDAVASARVRPRREPTAEGKGRVNVVTHEAGRLAARNSALLPSPSNRLGFHRQPVGLTIGDLMRLPTIYLVVIAAAGGLTEAVAADDRVIPPSPFQAYPAGSEITFEWVYSCGSPRPCAFSCAGSGSANGVTALQIYLGTTPLGSSNQKSPVIFYSFSTLTVPRNSGFRIITGIGGALACDVVGMTLDYSGPPR